MTKLGNASLFANGGSLIVMVWGLIAARRAPRVLELTAIAAALAGAALLMDGSLEISGVNLSRSEEHKSELQSLMRISYAVFCLKKKKKHTQNTISESYNYKWIIQKT